MQLHELIQGTLEWDKYRSSHFNASDASAVLGISKYKTRDKVLYEKIHGSGEIDSATQALFNKGHEHEATARPWAEEIIGEELYPVVMSEDIDGLPLSASVDGITISNEVAWEHKMLNKRLVASLSQGVIPEEYHPQMEQICMISGAITCLFMASSGDKDTMLHAWYKPNKELRAKIIQAWHQFKNDLDNYKHTAEAPTATAAPTLDLPAPYVKVDGSIAIQSNLEVFGLKLKEFVGGIDMKPEDDQGFANAEAAVKTLQKAQEALETAEATALAQTASIDEMRRTVALYVELARSTRLALDKVVKTQKDAVRAKLVREANDAMFSHLETVNKGLGGNYISGHKADFPSVIKGKKTITSIKSALNDEVARAKIVANESAEKIRENLQVIDAAKEYKFLFNDLHQIITKEPSDFLLLVDDRVGKHKVAEAEKLERERERIRIEEKAKATVAVTTETAQQTVPAILEPKKTATGKVKKPTKDEVITVLSSHYRVDKATVNVWLASWTFK